MSGLTENKHGYQNDKNENGSRERFTGKGIMLSTDGCVTFTGNRYQENHIKKELDLAYRQSGVSFIINATQIANPKKEGMCQDGALIDIENNLIGNIGISRVNVCVMDGLSPDIKDTVAWYPEHIEQRQLGEIFHLVTAELLKKNYAILEYLEHSGIYKAITENIHLLYDGTQQSMYYSSLTGALARIKFTEILLKSRIANELCKELERGSNELPIHASVLNGVICDTTQYSIMINKHPLICIAGIRSKADVMVSIPKIPKIESLVWGTPITVIPGRVALQALDNNNWPLDVFRNYPQDSYHRKLLGPYFATLLHPLPETKSVYTAAQRIKIIDRVLERINTKPMSQQELLTLIDRSGFQFFSLGIKAGQETQSISTIIRTDGAYDLQRRGEQFDPNKDGNLNHPDELKKIYDTNPNIFGDDATVVEIKAIF